MDKIQEYIEFFKGADILVFDAQYTLKESFDKIDFGHSSAGIGVDIAVKADVENLYLFHHEPAYDDFQMSQVYEKALKYKTAMAKNSELNVYLALEGHEVNL